ncbi:hypothetical protein [Arthrobacter sp. CJ23]|uniref:hypothetical protein n=1 Tax=Arthrobacter sp. CJ23 TaxID=2972479 RepID=UPI00215C2E93|nr:hypothetical protein [Arthrobacter sp. CJ23]UVJ40226.1 hypothetical protein NVV90_03290 [Arthrobacter sp. CJ23]
MRAPHARTPFHALRSAALSATIVALAAGAHVLAGGQLPAAPVLLALLALTGLVTTTATRFKLGFPVLGALLGAGQLALHEAFTVFSPLGITAPGQSGHHLGTGSPVPGIDAGAAHLHELDAPLGWLMLTGHVLASAASALVLAKGEQALWQLAAWLRPLLRVLRLVFRPDAGSSPVASGATALFTPRPWRNLRQDNRRGPPAVVVLP